MPSFLRNPKVNKSGVAAVDGKQTSHAQKNEIATSAKQNISENVAHSVGSAVSRVLIVIEVSRTLKFMGPSVRVRMQRALKESNVLNATIVFLKEEYRLT